MCIPGQIGVPHGPSQVGGQAREWLRVLPSVGRVDRCSCLQSLVYMVQIQLFTGHRDISGMILTGVKAHSLPP